MKKIFLAILLVLLVNSMTFAATVSYDIEGTVTAVNPLAAGFPTLLNGVTPGDQISVTLTYDADSPTSANIFSSSPWDAGTFYHPLNDFSFSVNINDVTFDTWSGSKYAMVWDDTSFSDSDGLVFSTLATSASANFLFGNLLLDSDTFSNDYLPTTNLPGYYGLNLMQGTRPDNWLEAQFNGLETASVPIPGAAMLFCSSIIGLFGIRKRFGK